MNTEFTDVDLKPLIALRIVVGALALGVLTFIGIAIAMSAGGQVPVAPNSEMIYYLGLAALVSALGLQPAILGAMDAAARKRINSNQSSLQPWLQAFSLRTILGCALIEGASFLCIIGSLLGGEPWGLIAGALGAAAMLGLHFPTTGRFAAYLEKQRAT